MQPSLDCLTASCELPDSAERDADTFGRQAGEIDVAGIARSHGGQRPLQIAAELGRHNGPLWRDQPFDSALCGNLDPCFRLVDRVGRCGPNIGFDMLRSR